MKKHTIFLAIIFLSCISPIRGESGTLSGYEDTRNFIRDSITGFHESSCKYTCCWNEVNTCQKEFKFTLDNDVLKPYSTDRFYTQGLILDFKILQEDKRNYGFTVAQKIYTPSDIKEKDVTKFDRPYAGWLYASVFGENIDNEERYDRFELTLGVIGPASLTGETQKVWHERIKSPQPQGWDYQIGNEIGVILHYEWNPLKVGHVGVFTERNLDIFPIVKINAGNIFDDVSVGFVSRAGVLKPYTESQTNIISFYNPNRKSSGLVPSEYFFFMRFDAKYVLYNALLQGGMVTNIVKGQQHNRHIVTPKRAVAQGDIGVSLNWEHFTFSYSFFGFFTPETNSGLGTTADLEAQKFGKFEIVARW